MGHAAVNVLKYKNPGQTSTSRILLVFSMSFGMSLGAQL